MGMLMSRVLSEVMLALREELGRVVPNLTYPERLFNHAQKQLSLELECVMFDYLAAVAARSSESGIAAASTTTLMVNTTSLDGAANDHYNGWILQNTTRKEQSYIVDTVYAGVPGINSLYLSRPISGQVTTDAITVIKERKTINLPWYVIRPYQDDGVKWDNCAMDPESISAIKEAHRLNDTNSGTPRVWAQEDQKLWIYPQPASAGEIHVSGLRRPANCFRVATTVNGNAAGFTVVSMAIPEKTDDYYRGSMLEIRSGTCLGESQVVDHYNASADTLYMEGSFGGQIASAVEIELQSGLSEDFQEAIENYIKWKLLKPYKEYGSEAENYRLSWEYEKQRLQEIYINRNTTFARAKGGMRGRRDRYTITSRSR